MNENKSPEVFKHKVQYGVSFQMYKKTEKIYANFG